MSLKLEREIAKERKRIDWIIAQLKNGMTDLATATVTKILEEGIEAEVKSKDERLAEALERELEKARN